MSQTTSGNPATRRGWIPGLLRVARTAYGIAAVASLAVFLLGLCVALYFQATISGGAQLATVPAPYDASTPSLNLGTVDAHLQPPSGLGIVVTHSIIDGPLQPGDVLGHFSADSANGLAAFPDDFEILGGKDADLFDRAPTQSGEHALLVATAALRRQVQDLPSRLKGPERREYSLLVTARDRYGLYAKPVNVTFSLVFAPPTPPPAQPAAAQPAPKVLSPLERLAQEIAALAPAGKQRQDVYAAALAEPARCGADPDNMAFVTDFRDAFDHARTRLKAQTLAPFFQGVCDAWYQALQQQEQARAAAEAARQSALAHNEQAQFRHQFEAAAARIERNFTLMVAGGALLAFLLVSLFLGFLAIENHSRATRDAVARLAAMTGSGENRS